MTAREDSPPNTAGGLAVDTDEAPPSNDPTQGRARSSLSNLVEALTYEPDEVVAVCHQDAQGGERGTFTHQHVPATADAIWDEASRWVDTSDVWWSVNPVVLPDGCDGRGTAEHVTRFAAAYADFDVKPGGLSSMAAAWEVVDVVSALLGHEPVVVISSGHGLQPVWSIDPADERTNLTPTTSIGRTPARSCAGSAAWWPTSLRRSLQSTGDTWTACSTWRACSGCRGR